MTLSREEIEALKPHALKLASIAWPMRELRPVGFGKPAWYLAHIVGRDARTVQYLGRLGDRYGLRFYYPQLRELVPVPRKKLSHQQRALGVTVCRQKLIPLFPRYIFVRVNLATLDWQTHFTLAGIVGIACNEGGAPYKVGDDLIAKIRAREIKGAVPGSTPFWELLEIGDRIRINAGPLEGHEGAVEAIRALPSDKFDSRHRIRIALALFGRVTSVELELDQIEPAEKSAR